MTLSNSTKYRLSSIALAVAVYLVYQYYSAAHAGPQRENLPWFLLTGAILLPLSGTAMVLWLYYYRTRDSATDQTARASALSAEAMLVSSIQDAGVIKVRLAPAELNDLVHDGKLRLAVMRFQQLPHQSQTVEAIGGSGVSIHATVVAVERDAVVLSPAATADLADRGGSNPRNKVLD